MFFPDSRWAQDSVTERIAHTIFLRYNGRRLAESRHASWGSKDMNPLTSLTGTVIAGLALLVVMVFVINVIGS